jgi:hypothetical protein
MAYFLNDNRQKRQNKRFYQKDVPRILKLRTLSLQLQLESLNDSEENSYHPNTELKQPEINTDLDKHTKTRFIEIVIR